MPQGLTDKLRRQFGRMPWTTTQKRLPRPYSVPVGGDGGVRNPNLTSAFLVGREVARYQLAARVGQDHQYLLGAD